MTVLRWTWSRLAMARSPRYSATRVTKAHRRAGRRRGRGSRARGLFVRGGGGRALDGPWTGRGGGRGRARGTGRGRAVEGIRKTVVFTEGSEQLAPRHA